MEVDRKQLADAFGVSTRTIRSWQRDRMPAQGWRKKRRYDTGDCMSSYVAERRGGASPPLRTGLSVVLRNAPGRSRTPNLRIRSPSLYPIELRAQSELNLLVRGL